MFWFEVFVKDEVDLVNDVNLFNAPRSLERIDFEGDNNFVFETTLANLNISLSNTQTSYSELCFEIRKILNRESDLFELKMGWSWIELGTETENVVEKIANLIPNKTTNRGDKKSVVKYDHHVSFLLRLDDSKEMESLSTLQQLFSKENSFEVKIAFNLFC